MKPESPDRMESDKRLEMLAEISGGKTFFVKDGMKNFVNQKSKFFHLFDFYLGSGLEDINAVFEECNTYQPSVPSGEATIVVCKFLASK